MATNLQEYKRSPYPALPESQRKWLEEELRKLERVLESYYQYAKELEARVHALENP